MGDREVRVQGHRVIRAQVQRVWQLLSRLESHPRYASLWMSADPLERTPNSALVEFRGFFGGLPVTSVQRFVLRPPGRIEFRQVRGTLRDLSGAYLLKDTDGEADLTIQMTVDAGITLFSDAAVQQILAGHIESTLVKIKASAERDLARVAPRRTQTAAGTDLAVEAEEPESGQLAVWAVDGAAGGEEAEAEAPVTPPAGPTPETERRGHPGGPRPRRRRRRRRRHRGGEGRPLAPGA